MPALETAGVKQMINGPESFTPDGNFILGAAPECANMFVGAGFNAFGIAVGGGAGWVLAQWVVDGEAPLDLWVVDIRRFSDLHRDRALGRATARWRPMASTTRSASRTRNIDSGRPRIVSPLYERLKAHRAVFGSKLGWERPNWFAPEGIEPRDVYSMGRQNWFAPVGDEHRHVRERGRHLRPVVLRQIRADRHGRRRRRWTGSAPTTSTSRPAGSPTRSCSTRAAASRPT